MPRATLLIRNPSIRSLALFMLMKIFLCDFTYCQTAVSSQPLIVKDFRVYPLISPALGQRGESTARMLAEFKVNQPSAVDSFLIVANDTKTNSISLQKKFFRQPTPNGGQVTFQSGSTILTVNGPTLRFELKESNSNISELSSTKSFILTVYSNAVGNKIKLVYP